MVLSNSLGQQKSKTYTKCLTSLKQFCSLTSSSQNLDYKKKGKERKELPSLSYALEISDHDTDPFLIKWNRNMKEGGLLSRSPYQAPIWKQNSDTVKPLTTDPLKADNLYTVDISQIYPWYWLYHYRTSTRLSTFSTTKKQTPFNSEQQITGHATKWLIALQNDLW